MMRISFRLYQYKCSSCSTFTVTAESTPVVQNDFTFWHLAAFKNANKIQMEIVAFDASVSVSPNTAVYLSVLFIESIYT